MCSNCFSNFSLFLCVVSHDKGGFVDAVKASPARYPLNLSNHVIVLIIARLEIRNCLFIGQLNCLFVSIFLNFVHYIGGYCLFLFNLVSSWFNWIS